MKIATQRMVIYPKDVQLITGRSERYSRVLLKKVKTNFSKQEHQFVTVDEFCQYTGLKKEQVQSFLL